MRLVTVSRHLPEVSGTAAGRILHATTAGLREAGHDAQVVSWSPDPPAAALPDWCRWQPLPPEPGWRTRTRALVRPRADTVRLVGDLADVPDDAVAVADDPLSFAAIAHRRSPTVTIHYATVLDRRALASWRAKDVQDARADRRVARRAALTMAYSDRVARAVPARRVAVVPVAWPAPASPVYPVDAPVAALLADWRWAPNRVAAARLLTAWPAVRAELAGAQLLLAGRGELPVGTLPGVSWLGEVADSREVLDRAAVLAFPCPATSGPKVKVLEATAAGLPVVTTVAGVEGLDLSTDAVWLVRDARTLAASLVAALADPAPRAERAARARRAVMAVHDPVVAARARVAALTC